MTKLKLFLSIQKNLKLIVPTDLMIVNENVTFANSAKKLGVFIDADVLMSSHITYLSKAVFIEIRRI